MKLMRLLSNPAIMSADAVSLAAFAQTSGAALATLDRKLPARYPSARVESLLPSPTGDAAAS